MYWLLERALSLTIHVGDLEVIDADGTARRYGDGSGAPIRVRFADRAIERRVSLDPTLALGEGYMQGRIQIEEGDVFGFISLLFENARRFQRPGWMKRLNALRTPFRRLKQINTAIRARRNVQRHYDINIDLYKKFLDAEMTYSCGYFRSEHDSLEQAQVNKFRRIAAKLALKPGERVLDIGSGFGGLALYLARRFDVSVTGVTLSDDQLAFSQQRAQALGLSDRVSFRLQDYRAVDERFDKIVSVGMLEHVGVGYFQAFFDKVHDLLEPDGVALIHSIGRFGPPEHTNAFIAKHIFPGGYIPALSEITSVVERNKLFATDIEIWRLHYARTLNHWRRRTIAARDEIIADAGEEFFRMWEFYLASSEASFIYGRYMVFHLQLTRSQTALDLTRDYIGAAERALLGAASPTDAAAG